MLTGDFNDDVYRGNIAEQLADADLNTRELLFKTTGVKIPPTHEYGSTRRATEVTQRGSLIGYHMVFMRDTCSHSILGDLKPIVISPFGRILRNRANTYKSKYNKDLEQFVD